MASNLPKAQRIELMRRAWRLAVGGMPQTAIADELKISQSQVSRYLKVIASRTADRLADEARVYMILSLNQTDQVLHQAMLAFERSTRPKKKARKTSGDGSTMAGGPAESKTTTEVTEREGDPAWLATAMACIRLRHELLPTPEPEKVEDDDAGDGTVAGALLAAERRNAAYQTDHPPTPETTEP